MGLKLGCIADDFTGATDLANNLVRAGMRVVQTIGVSASPLPPHCDAVVIALKTRTIPPAEAVAQSLAALRWLQAQGVEQVYFKYCSTFDSWYEGEVRGNIGPVTEALMDAMGCDFTIATPAFPDNQRTVFKGHLFVGDVLLSDSGMKDHPLTPMNDANLVTVMQAQCQRRVGLVDYRVMSQGEAAIRSRFDQLRNDGVAVAVLDALARRDAPGVLLAFAELAQADIVVEAAPAALRASARGVSLEAGVDARAARRRGEADGDQDDRQRSSRGDEDGRDEHGSDLSR